MSQHRSPHLFSVMIKQLNLRWIPTDCVDGRDSVNNLTIPPTHSPLDSKVAESPRAGETRYVDPLPAEIKRLCVCTDRSPSSLHRRFFVEVIKIDAFPFKH